MLDIRALSENLPAARERLRTRGFDDPSLDQLGSLVARRKEVIAEEESLRAKRNEVSKAMASIRDKASSEFETQREAMRGVGEQIKDLEGLHRDLQEAIDRIVSVLPNLPHESTPAGLSEEQNVVVRVVGNAPDVGDSPKDHVELGVALGLLDFERASKISGARFCVLRGIAARLERALISFMLDLHREKHGYEEMWLPALVRGSSLFGTGQLPKFAEDVFQIARHEGWAAHQSDDDHDFFLSPTAEVQLTNLHAGEILAAEDMPRAYTAFTPCFRAEAGSYGRDTRGLIRQHQFDKVELVRLVAPDDGERELDRLTAHAEAVLQQLELHYRVVQLCAGDMGFAAQKTYDLEVWLPSQNAFREISSCSWFGAFQARRANIRYRPAQKAKPKYVHTLNGSGLAVGRTLVALLEQCQQRDGSVAIPRVLRPYLGGLDRIVAGAR